MRFLADENFPGAAVEALARIGHDVSWIRILAPGISDKDVLEIAARESRVVLTFDKDFGERARAAKLPTSCGVVLFRIPMPLVRNAAKLVDTIAARSDWAGHFSVVEPGRIRMRAL
jgi:hypothetical protein